MEMNAVWKIRGKKTKKIPAPGKTGGFVMFSRQIWRFQLISSISTKYRTNRFLWTRKILRCPRTL